MSPWPWRTSLHVSQPLACDEVVLAFWVPEVELLGQFLSWPMMQGAPGPGAGESLMMFAAVSCSAGFSSSAPAPPGQGGVSRCQQGALFPA